MAQKRELSPDSQAKLILECERLKFLMDSDAGKWLLRNLIRESKALSVIHYEGGGKESYNRGRQDLVLTEIISPIVKNFGYAALDRIMKE